VLPEHVSHFIGGRPVRSALGKRYGVADPATGKEYAQVEVGTAGDVSQAVLAARAALETGPWPAMTAADRAGALRAIADAVGARADDITGAESLGAGLPVTEAREQAERAAAVFRQAAELTAAGPADDEVPGPRGRVLTRPAGVAGLITPWRTPFLAQARAVAPALAAGCTVVLRPDEYAPLPAALLAEIVTAAGLPAGVLNLVHGSLNQKALGTETLEALAAHPGVDRLAFAGDAATGRQLRLAATALACVEPPGPAPALIFADADLDQAVDAALFGAFALGGQRRTATSVIGVERACYEAVVGRLAERADRLRVGAPADPATQLGPVPHPGHYDTLASAVRLGVREGARLAAGGRRPAGLTEGNYLAATVLADVTPSMRVCTEPVCGPVLRVAPFDTDAEAVALARAIGAAGQGTTATAYLWTADRERAGRLALDLACAAVWVNAHNPGDRLAAAAEADVGFYRQPVTVLTGACDAPVPRLGT
jgi:5-carboxymethyl-2-hydroxymuconic-semialdehyde dehydrogenase